MNLGQAFRLGKTPRLAFVGSGGKTSALFSLARQIKTDGARTVILTTTTHLARLQLIGADHCFEITSREHISALAANIPSGIVLIHGGIHGERAVGLQSEFLIEIFTLADRFHWPLLFEADGSRLRPIKAPGEHEPAIPKVKKMNANQQSADIFDAPLSKSWLDSIVVTVGLSGLGKPLEPEWVHRPEIFARLSGIAIGEAISIEGLANEMTHPEGGLKNIPSEARRIALLNQADTPALQAAGARLGQRLLERGYDSAVLAALKLPEPIEAAGYYKKEPGTVQESEVFLTLEPIAGIILAAGESSRMGQAKPLLSWREETFIHRIARTALDAGLSPVVVVSGSHSDEIRQAVVDLPVDLVYNPDWASGQSSSLIAGLRCLPARTGGAIFLLGDQPQTPTTLLRSLCERHAETLAPILAPLIDGQRGNPVLFDRLTFPDLLALQGDTGGRALFARYPLSWLAWHDPIQLLDVDQPGDYQKLLELDQLE